MNDGELYYPDGGPSGKNTMEIIRDGKMGWARRASPPARQKKHRPGQEIQPANPIQPGSSSLLACQANPRAKTGQPAARTT